MSHFGIICPPIAGHLNPLAAVGRALVRRGHRVTLLQVQELEAKAHSEGLRFAALGKRDFPVGELAGSVQKLSNLTGRAALQFTIGCACKVGNMILRDAPAVAEREEIEALLVDQNEPAGGTVAEHLKIPFLSVCTSLPLNREPAIPPPFVGWKFSSSVLAKARNLAGYAIADRLIAPIQNTLNGYRKRWKLPAIKTPNDTFSLYGSIAQMPREFDFPRREGAGLLHYLGPWFDSHSSAGVGFPFDQLDGRPVVYGSIGTLQSASNDCFRIMAEACAGLNVQLVLSLGKPGYSSALKFPGNPILRDFVPQLELLQRAAVTITHAGMNTTIHSMHYGVPAIAVPLAHDQSAIAARLARTGAGVVLPLSRFTPDRLRAQVEALLPESSAYRIRARFLQRKIAASGGVERAADIAERLVQ